MNAEITLDKAKELLTKECQDILKLPGLLETLDILASETAKLGNGVVEKTLSAYDYYRGQLNGIEMALVLVDRLPKTRKIPWICESADHPYTKYKCEVCGYDDVEEEANYCSHCGALFIE